MLFRFLALIALAAVAAGSDLPPCEGGRLVPSDYGANAVSFDVVRLPEAWCYMKDKWYAWDRYGDRWPMIAVVDDGFFPVDDLGYNGHIKGDPTYDGNGAYHQSALGDEQAPVCQGYHGTAVATLLLGITNNGKSGDVNIASASGCWQVSGKDVVGSDFLPIRVTGGYNFSARVGCGTIKAMASALSYAAGANSDYHRDFPYNTYAIRVINVSKTIVPGNDFWKYPDPTPGVDEDLKNLMKASSLASMNAVLVIGAGNDRRVMNDKGWIDQYAPGRIVTVGALNRSGTAYWDYGEQQGTRRGSGVDIFAPGEPHSVQYYNRSAEIPGTSFAAPLVSGVLALMWNANPCASNADHIRWLLESADRVPMPDGRTIRRLNAAKAVRMAYDEGGVWCR